MTVIYQYLKAFNCVQKMSSGSFKNVINKICLQIIHILNMHREDLVLNNLQWLIGHKTQPNQPFKLCTNKWIILDSNTWNYLTVCKQVNSTNLFKNEITFRLFTYKSNINQINTYGKGIEPSYLSNDVTPYIHVIVWHMVGWLMFYGISTFMGYCCGLQIRLVEEQLKQRVIGKRYCISRKRTSYKGSTSHARLAVHLSNVS